MICTRCSAVNDNDDRFCFKCGASLPVAGESYSAPQGEQDERTRAENEATSLATINAQTMLAAKEARKTDISTMRPFTRLAYNIAESENGTMLSMVVSVLHILCGFGAVATLIKIFETISKLGDSFSSSGISGSLSEVFYGSTSKNNAQLLIWLVLLFVVVSLGFICCGKLNIRIKKVNRKKKKEQLDSRL